MKFFRHFESRLMNETEGNDGGSFAAANDYSSTAAISDDGEQAFKDAGLDLNKYFSKDENDSSDESLDEESQGSDESEEAGQETDEKSFLNLVNSLGLVHNENPFQVSSKDELKNLVQMGRDYTQKTQTLSEERKAFDSEKASAESELTKAIEEYNNNVKSFESQLQEMQQFTFALNNLQQNAPDIFEEVQRAYKDVGDRYRNPIIDQQLAAMNKRLAEAESHLKTREDKLIMDGFESEKSQLTATEQSLKELGINVDWNQVKEQWAKSGMPLKSVLGSIYFDSLAKAQASKNKVDQTKMKTNAKTVAGAGSSRTGNKVKAIDPKLKGLSFASALWDRHTA